MSALAMPTVDGSLHRLSTGAILSIDPTAIAANTRRLVTATDAAVMAVVKANGFGHGAALVARVALANGASWLGVTSLAEALELRGAGIDAPVLSWLNATDTDFTDAVTARIDVAVPSLQHLEAVLAAGGRSRVH